MDLAAVRSIITGGKRSFCADQPVVLILHTHAQEGYRADDAPPYCAGTVGDAVYSDNPAQSVLAAGEALAGELNRNGIPAIHCTAIHGEGGTLRGAYRAAAECIQAYLKQYPSIEYVIDLHRDGILDTDGACLRTASAEGKAQVMAVIDSLPITYEQNGQKKDAVAVEIDDNGGLIVEDTAGSRTTLQSGEISLRLRS